MSTCPSGAAHYPVWRAGGAGRWGHAGDLPGKGPRMSRNLLSRFVIAAVLVLALLLPSAAFAQGPVRNAASAPGWSQFWGLLRQFLGNAGFLKNGSQIDPNGAPQGDNRGTIDPNGAPQSDNRWTIDPNG